MKKVRFSTTKGSAGRKFQIFNSPESLYVWLNDPELQAAARLDPTLGTTIFLRPGEVMEAEWMGCEFIREDGYVLRVDEIRLAKTIKVKSLDTSNVVGVHSGWVTEDILSFKSGAEESVKRTRLTKKSKHKFSIGDLFVAKNMSKNEDYSADPQDVH